MTLVSVEKAFNEIWQVTVSRRGLQRFLSYWGVLTCGPPLVVGGLLVSSYVISLPLISDADTVGLRATLLGYLPPLLSCVAFTVLFAAVPNCRVRFKHALVGGVLTMLFFEAAKRLFTGIVANANMQLIYGTFAAVPLFLTWLYLVWVLVLSGAIVVRTLGLERDDVQSDGAPPVVQCVRMLAFLHSAHLHGRSVTRSDLNDCGEAVADRARVGAIGIDRTAAVVDWRTRCRVVGQGSARCQPAAARSPIAARTRSRTARRDTRSAALNRTAARICALWC